MLDKANMAARWLSRDGNRDPEVRESKHESCPRYATEDPEFGDEVYDLASRLRDITG